jgi:hypothetical protein
MSDRLTPFGVIAKYAEEENLAWGATHADALLDRFTREGYQVVDGPRATDQPCDRVPPVDLKNHDRIVVGLHGQWLGDVIGTHQTVDNEEVMIVMVVPAESVFEVAGRSPFGLGSRTLAADRSSGHESSAPTQGPS